MKIELKNVTVSERLSEETMCFAADLWIDGKKIGTVSNRGTGGCDDFHGDRAAYKRADEWCKANLPPWVIPTEHGIADLTGPTDLEVYVGELIERHLAAKKIARLTKGKVLFIQPGERGVYTVAPKAKGTDPKQIIPSVMARHPNATILNVLPMDQAVTLYLRHG